MRKKNSYREWSEELFHERKDKPIYHGDGTISFVTNCDHVVKGTVVLLYPASKVPCVFCANCGGWIATLKQWQEWDQEHREIYKDSYRPKLKLSFSTGDFALRSYWDSDPMGQINVKWVEYPRARGLFRNLGKKITKAIRENEERNDWYIWNEIRESDKIIDITIPPSRVPDDGMKEAPYVFDFSTISEISELLLEKEGDKK